MAYPIVAASGGWTLVHAAPRPEVVLEPPDPHSGMRYLYDRELGTRINTATFQGQDPEPRLRHMDELGVDIQVVSIPPPGADRFAGAAAVDIARTANDALAELCRAPTL